MTKKRTATDTDELNTFRRDAALAILVAYLHHRTYCGEGPEEDMVIVPHAIRMADRLVAKTTEAPAALPAEGEQS